MNYLSLAGHLGSDPEARFTASGKKVTTFSLATKTRKAGKDATIWWRITIWGEQFDNMMKHLKKGSSVIVHGELQPPEIFTNREGKQQISMGVTASHLQFSPFGRVDKQAPAEQESTPSQEAQQSTTTQDFEHEEVEEEVPF